jgi:hypothetical protein
LTFLANSARLWRRLFPERQFLLRSHGKVRYLRLGGPTQTLLLASLAVMFGSLIFGTTANYLKVREVAGRDARIAELTSAYNSLSASMLRQNERYGDITGELERKQQLLIRALEQRDTLKQQLSELSGSMETADHKLTRAEQESRQLHKQIAEMQARLRLTEGERGRLANNL